jgi:hypothetical protein
MTTWPGMTRSIVMFASCLLAAVAGCGGHTVRASPYTPDCVSSAFAQIGVPLGVLNGSVAKLGWVVLGPEDETLGVTFQLLVMATPAAAVKEMVSARLLKQYRPGFVAGTVAVRRANLFVSYRDKRPNRVAVARGLRAVATRCG